jgi:hypothetical protein
MRRSFLGVRDVLDSTKVKLSVAAKLLQRNQAQIIEAAIESYFDANVKHRRAELLGSLPRRRAR